MANGRDRRDYLTVEIRIYAEGGGNGKDSKALFRQGLGEFLRELRTQARSTRTRWAIVACGARSEAYRDFCAALRSHPEAFNVLLVDAEGPVTTAPWEHLRGRDGWSKPRANDEQCHLMVEVMESWFIADLSALKRFYGNDVNDSMLPGNTNVEEVQKDQVISALENATRHTTKGKYRKRHASKLLKCLDPATVRDRAPHCKRIFSTITERLKPN